MVIEPIKMQPALTSFLGPDLAQRYCGPVAFYMLIKAAGYLPEDLEVDQFVATMDRQALTTQDFNWSRPAISRYLRHKYGAKIISWQLNGQRDIAKMREAGYLGSDEEVEFFDQHIYGRDIKAIVHDGYPVIVTMSPGFNTPGRDPHAVIIVEWQGDTVTLIDPDDRNTRSQFTASEVLECISPAGGGTVILPKDEVN